MKTADNKKISPAQRKKRISKCQNQDSFEFTNSSLDFQIKMKQ